MNSVESIPQPKESELLRAGALSRDFLERVLGSAVSVEHLVTFEQALAQVSRWKSTDPRYQVADKEHGVHETVLDHIRGMLMLVNELERTSPHLAERVRFDDIRIMILLHDLGETLRGDIPRSDQQGNNVARQKHVEQLWTNRLLRSVADESIRARLVKLLGRYEKRELTDVEAHIAKYIDVVQSAQFGATSGIFNTYARHGLGYRGSGSVRVPGEFVSRHDTIVRCLKSLEEVDEFMAFAFTHLISFLGQYYPQHEVQLIGDGLHAFRDVIASELS